MSFHCFQSFGKYRIVNRSQKLKKLIGDNVEDKM